MQVKDPVKAVVRREKKAEAARQWRRDNPELAAKKARERYHRDPQAAAAKVQKWRKEHPEQWSQIQRAGRLKRLYGLSLSDYDAMLIAQNGKCAMCGTTDPKSKTGDFAVDHDHSTNRVRELLCNPCNTGLGFLRDDPKILAAGIAYLEKHRAMPPPPPQPAPWWG